MAKDLNDAVREGRSVRDLVDAAAASAPLQPVNPQAVAADGIKHLKAIISQVETDLQDPLNGAESASRNVVKAIQSEKHRWSLGAASVLRDDETKALLAQLNSLDPRLRTVLKSLREVITAGAKRFADAMRTNDDTPVTPPKGKSLLEAVTRELGLVGFRCPAGYDVDVNGVFLDDGTQLSAAPILPISSSQTANGAFMVEVAWRKWGKWWRRHYPREVLANARLVVGLAKAGAPVDSGTSAELVKFFSAFERVNEEKFAPVLGVEHIGWVSEKTFLYGHDVMGEAVSFVGDEDQVQFLSGFRVSGSWETWRAAIAEHCAGRPKVMLGVYAALASVLLTPIEQRGFIIDWSGLTSVGKTSTLQVAASVLGDPSEHDHDGLIRSWRGPSNFAKMAAASTMYSLPLFLDETKRANNADLVKQMLYDYPSGQESMSGKSTGGARQGKRWRSVLLSTGEAPITSFSKDGGAHARALIVRGQPWGGVSDQVAAAISSLIDTLKAHHGHLGRRFVEYLLNTDWFDLKQRYATIVEGYGPQAGVEKRLHEYVATIELAAQIAHLSLGLPGDWRPAIDVLRESIAASSGTTDIPAVAAQTLYEWAASNRSKFWNTEASPDHEPSRGWYGRWDRDRDLIQAEYIGFNLDLFLRTLDELGFDGRSVMTAFMERKWLRLDKHDKNPQVGPNRSRVVCVLMKAMTE